MATLSSEIDERPGLQTPGLQAPGLRAPSEVPSPEDAASQTSPAAVPARQAVAIPSFWKEPLLAWILTRFICFTAMAVGATLFPMPYDLRVENPSAGQVDLPEYFRSYAANPGAFGKKPMIGMRVGGQWGWLEPFIHWDCIWYLSIAEVGYIADAALPAQQNVCFFPLYPLAIKACSLLGMNSILAALAISNLSTLAAMCLLYRFVALRSGVLAARWTLALWSTFPSALFGCVAYADPLLALIGILSLTALIENRTCQAGFWAGLGSAIRPSGLSLAFTLIPSLFGRRWWRGIVGGVLAGTGIAAYFAYLWWYSGDPLLYPHVIRNWQSQGSVWNPLYIVPRIVQSALYSAQLAFRGTPKIQIYSVRVTDPFLLLWALFYIPRVWRLGWGPFLGAAVMILLPTCGGNTTTSIGRYLWAIMPLFAVAGPALAASRWRWITVPIFFVLLCWLSFLYGGGWEVI